MTIPASGHLRTNGASLEDGAGQPIRLRGVCLGGWMNMENFITGYPATESLMRASVRDVLGQDRSEMFFDRLLTAFFDDTDAELIADSGLNSIRIAVNYRHFEDDSEPFRIKEAGFRHLDRVIALCAARGIYSIIDLHALQGYQNHHWHSDNPTHVPMLWEHRQFQDRVVHLWEALADHYKDNIWVAGYNLINEPADESRQVLPVFYQRLVDAVRTVDPHHTLFVDGNTYSTDFQIFGAPWDNTIYVCHDYAAPGLGHGGPYPGHTRGQWFDKEKVEAQFLARSEFSRRTGTPIWVGEFGVIYTGNEAVDQQRRQLLDDQLEIYDRHGAGWALWMYKDLGRQGLAGVKPDTAYRRRFGNFIAKKIRLGADQWGSTDDDMRHLVDPVRAAFEKEFPSFDPYPWGSWDWQRTLLLNIMFAQPLVSEYAALFEGLEDAELLALADSFALENCDVRTELRSQLRRE